MMETESKCDSVSSIRKIITLDFTAITEMKMSTINNSEVTIMNRIGEDFSIPKRTARVFEVNDYWYYSTREGIDIGPFDTPQAAETGISNFIDFVLHAEPQVLESLNKYGRAA